MNEELRENLDDIFDIIKEDFITQSKNYTVKLGKCKSNVEIVECIGKMIEDLDNLATATFTVASNRHMEAKPQTKRILIP